MYYVGVKIGLKKSAAKILWELYHLKEQTKNFEITIPHMTCILEQRYIGQNPHVSSRKKDLCPKINKQKNVLSKVFYEKDSFQNNLPKNRLCKVCLEKFIKTNTIVWWNNLP